MRGDAGGSCQQFADPGEDPPIGGTQGSSGGGGFNVNAGYSDEETRARLVPGTIPELLA